MNLRELIERLEHHPPNLVVERGFDDAHSYRGYYDQLAFSPARNVTVASMLTEAREAIGSTHFGWKGGEYTMDLDTPVHVAEPGDCCDDGSMLEMLMEIDGQQLRAERDRLSKALHLKPGDALDGSMIVRKGVENGHFVFWLAGGGCISLPNAVACLEREQRALTSPRETR